MSSRRARRTRTSGSVQTSDGRTQFRVLVSAAETTVSVAGRVLHRVAHQALSVPDELVVNVGDHPEAEVPDAEGWTPLRPATSFATDLPVFKNHLYTVTVQDAPSASGEHVVTHLSIRRNDRHWVRDWRHFQRIKNEVCGPEREAVEIYPAESRLVDEANQFHLWVMPEGMVVPFGFEQREVQSDPGQGRGWRQRPHPESEEQ